MPALVSVNSLYCGSHDFAVVSLVAEQSGTLLFSLSLIPTVRAPSLPPRQYNFTLVFFAFSGISNLMAELGINELTAAPVLIQCVAVVPSENVLAAPSTSIQIGRAHV